MYDIITTIETECESLFEIKDLVAKLFIDNRHEEEVMIKDSKLGKEYTFSIYDADIVKLINAHLQIAHFGGTLESA